jgi:hypothetical protein
MVGLESRGSCLEDRERGGVRLEIFKSEKILYSKRGVRFLPPFIAIFIRSPEFLALR